MRFFLLLKKKFDYQVKIFGMSTYFGWSKITKSKDKG